MIVLTEIRTLAIVPTDDGGPLRAYVSAASGLVCLGTTLYVVADDALHLGIFSLDSPAPGRLFRLFDGALPDEKAERKRRKPDLEALVHIPPFDAFPDGALLALGSGSRANRQRGVLLGLDPAGGIAGAPRVIDLAGVFGPLSGIFPDLNIEGAVVADDRLRLFQRGNQGRRDNAVLSYPLAQVLPLLLGGGQETLLPETIHRLDLGEIDGVALGLTDATMLPDGRMVVSAVAEDTDDAYRDGACVGAALGIVDADGALVSLERLERPDKVEGISLGNPGGRPHLLLVTDADDPAIPAVLLSLPLAPFAAERTGTGDEGEIVSHPVLRSAEQI